MLVRKEQTSRKKKIGMTLCLRVGELLLLPAQKKMVDYALFLVMASCMIAVAMSAKTVAATPVTHRYATRTLPGVCTCS